jgi:hypothetical protein
MARLERLPQAIVRKWLDVSGAASELASGRALALPQKADARSARRAERARSKLNRDPAFRAEVQRLLAIVVTDELAHYPSADPLTPLWEAIREAEESSRRGEIVYREGRQFAAEHPFQYITPDAVVAALVDAINQHLPGPRVPPPRLMGRADREPAIIYVNPLRDTDLTAPVGSGRILVDVTDLSYDDLTALAPALATVQARLGYTKQRGRHYEGDAEQMEFVHQLRTTPTGRGKQRTWKQVRDMFHKQFDEDISEATLKVRYGTWQRVNRFDRSKEIPRE